MGHGFVSLDGDVFGIAGANGGAEELAQEPEVALATQHSNPSASSMLSAVHSTFIKFLSGRLLPFLPKEAALSLPALFFQSGC